jgi:hypothetical protein
MMIEWKAKLPRKSESFRQLEGFDSPLHFKMKVLLPLLDEKCSFLGENTLCLQPVLEKSR